jgi:hypothetical protein
MDKGCGFLILLQNPNANDHHLEIKPQKENNRQGLWSS